MTSSTNPRLPTTIDPETTVGTVRLTVRDLDRARDFYQTTIGLRASDLDGGELALAGPDGRPLIELSGDPSADALNRRATGLYHLAIVVPTRRDLAAALLRLAHARWPLDGASDHLVSEALYLSDPEGNGIEIYRDRPREQWRRRGDQLEMATLALDLPDLLAELDADPELEPLAPAGTRVGHVHLQVADLEDAERFYSGILGFEVTVRGYPGALFVSAGGYHHHIGLNTWHSRGSRAPAPGSVGLRSFAVELPSGAELEAVLERVQSAGLAVQRAAGGALVRDPSGNGILLQSR